MKKLLLTVFLVFFPTLVFAAATSYKNYGSLPEAQPNSDGELLFKELGCVMCHGYQGMGDGLLSEGLDPKPRNFTSYEQMVRLPDLQMEQSIRNGRQGTAMPSFNQLTEKQIQDLVAYIRSLLAESYLTVNMCITDTYIIDTKKDPEEFRVEVDDPEKIHARKDGKYIHVTANNWPMLMTKRVSRTHIRLMEKNNILSLIAVRFHNCSRDLEHIKELCKCKDR